MTAMRIRDLVSPDIQTVDPRRHPDDEFLYVDISSVDNRTKTVGALLPILGRDTPTRARQVVRANDVIVATTRPYLNAVARIPQALDGQVCSTGFCVLRPGARLDPGYLFWWVQHPAFVGALTVLAQGAVYPAVNDSDVLDQELPLPGLERQREIAARLTDELRDVNVIRDATRGRAEGTNSLRARTYDEAFANQIPFDVRPSNVDAHDGWSWQVLTDLARLETGHTPSRVRDDWWGGDVSWIALPDIRNVDGRVTFETIETTNADGIAHSAARILPTDTVVMSRTASVGFVTRMGRPMATSQDFVNWVCGPDLDPEFLMHLLIRSRAEIRSLASGAIHKTIYFPTVKTFRVCVPPIDEQRRIAARLRERLATIDSIDSAIQEEQKTIEALPAALLRRHLAIPAA